MRFFLLACFLFLPSLTHAQKQPLPAGTAWLEWRLNVKPLPRLWQKARAKKLKHWKRYNTTPAHLRAVRALRFRIQRAGLHGVYVGTYGKQVRVCLHGRAWVRPALRKQKRPWTLKRLQQFLTRQSPLGFHVVEDDHNDAINIFESMKKTLPKKLKFHVTSYSRPSSSRRSLGYDRYFTGPPKLLAAWVNAWNQRLDKHNKARKYTRPYKLALLMSQYYYRGTWKLQWRTLLVWRKASISGLHLHDQQVKFDAPSKRYNLQGILDPAGADRLEQMTGAHVGHRFALMLGKVALVAPVIQARIAGGRLRLSLGPLKTKKESLEEAKSLSAFIETALPTPTTFGSQHTHRANVSFCRRLARQRPPKVKVPSAGITRRIGGAFRRLWRRIRKKRHCVAWIDKKHCIEKSILQMRWRSFRQMRRVPSYLVRTFKQRFLDEQIAQVLFARAAQKAGIKVSAKDVQKVINRDPNFFAEGKFSKDMYKRVLDYLGAKDKAYRQSIRRRLLRERYTKHRRSNTKVSAQEVWARYQRDNTKVKLRGMGFSLRLFKDLKQPLPGPAPGEIQGFSSRHKSAILAYYRKNLHRYVTRAKVRARHILRKLPPTASAQQVTQVTGLMNTILAKARANPRSFAALAREHSQGPTKVRGGDLGYFRRGVMVPSFERAAFGLRRPGQVSGIVRTRFGLHIIQLVDRKPGGRRSLRQVQSSIARTLWIRQKQRDLLRNTLGWLRTQWQKAGSIKKLKAALKERIAAPSPPSSGPKRAMSKALLDAMKFYRIPPFPRHARTVPGIRGDCPQLVQAAFRLTASQPYTTPIQVKDSLYLFKLYKRKEANRARFRKEKKELRERLITMRLSESLDKERKRLRKAATITINRKMLNSVQ